MRYPLDGRLSGPQSRSVRCAEENIFFPQGLVAILTEFWKITKPYLFMSFPVRYSMPEALGHETEHPHRDVQVTATNLASKYYRAKADVAHPLPAYAENLQSASSRTWARNLCLPNRGLSDILLKRQA